MQKKKKKLTLLCGIKMEPLRRVWTNPEELGEEQQKEIWQKWVKPRMNSYGSHRAYLNDQSLLPSLLHRVLRVRGTLMMWVIPKLLKIWRMMSAVYYYCVHIFLPGVPELRGRCTIKPAPERWREKDSAGSSSDSRLPCEKSKQATWRTPSPFYSQSRKSGRINK